MAPREQQAFEKFAQNIGGTVYNGSVTEIAVPDPASYEMKRLLSTKVKRLDKNEIVVLNSTNGTIWVSVHREDIKSLATTFGFNATGSASGGGFGFNLQRLFARDASNQQVTLKPGKEQDFIIPNGKHEVLITIMGMPADPPTFFTRNLLRKGGRRHEVPADAEAEIYPEAAGGASIILLS